MGWNSRTGRPNTFPVDTTDLGGPTIQVAPRVAWLLRTNRLDSAYQRPRDFVARVRELGLPPLSGGPNDVETRGRQLTAETITTYEQALDLQAGGLLGVADGLWRSFRAGGPRHPSSMSREDRWDELARLDGHFQDGCMTGSDWLSFSNLVNRPDGHTPLPSVLEEWSHRLVTELMRSLGPAYTARGEAMARLLREDRPRAAVVQAVRDAITEKGAQSSVDAVAVLGDAPGLSTLDEVLRILTTAEDSARRGAALALLQWGMLGELRRADLARVTRALVAVADDDPVHGAQTALLAAPFVSRRLTTALLRRIAVVGDPVQEMRIDARPPHLAQYLGAAVAYSQAPGDRMIERLLQEALSDDGGRRHHALELIQLSPYRSVVADAAVRVCLSSPDAGARSSAGTVLGYLAGPTHQSALVGMLRRPDRSLRYIALKALAHGPGVPADVDLHEHLIDPEVAPAAIYAAGLSGHPDVRSALESRFVSTQVREGAGWWLRHGSRVVV